MEDQRNGRKSFSAAAPTTQAVILAAGSSKRIALTLRNAGSVTVYLGKDATVTSASGYPLKVDEVMTDDNSSDAWWGITASGTGDIRMMEVTR